ncbi:XkdX family protein [Lactobacillus phage CV244]|nr:XkdX family protein [Lactobacillus phage CV244]
MFEIYSYMFTSGLFSAHELSTYIGYGLTEAQYQEIVGEAYVAPQAQTEQPQA